MALPLQARPDDQRQTAVAPVAEHHLVIPAMKADAFSGGRAILISGSGAESVRLGSMPRRSVPAGQLFPAQWVATGVCTDYVIDTLNYSRRRE